MSATKTDPTTAAPPPAGTTFHVYVVTHGEVVEAAFMSREAQGRSDAARLEDRQVPPEPRLAVATVDGRVFLLGDEVAFNGKIADGDEAVVARALDKLDPASRAAVERQRPPRSKPKAPREPRPGDPDYVSDASWPK